MKNLNLPPFYVGQRVVYVGRSGRPKTLPVNSEWIAKNVRKFDCGCWCVDVGLFHERYHHSRICADCNIVTRTDDNARYFDCRAFAPIEHKFKSITFEEVIAIESPLIGIN